MNKEIIENIKDIKWQISEYLIFTVDTKSADLEFLTETKPHQNLTELTVKDFIISSYIFGFPIILCSETGMGKTYNIDHFINSFGLKKQTYYWSPSSKIDDIRKFKGNKKVLFLDHYNLSNFHVNKDSREKLDNEIKIRTTLLSRIKNEFDFIIAECCPALSHGYVSWGVLDLNELFDFIFVPIANKTNSLNFIEDIFFSKNKENILNINDNKTELFDEYRKNNKDGLTKLSNRQRYSLIALLTYRVKYSTEQNTIGLNDFDEFPWNRIGLLMENEIIKWLKESGYTY